MSNKIENVPIFKTVRFALNLKTNGSKTENATLFGAVRFALFKFFIKKSRYFFGTVFDPELIFIAI